MPGKTVTVILGVIFYILGIISVNIFLDSTEITLFFHPAIELAIIAVGIFFLSSLFYGKFSFALLFFAGAFLGKSFSTKPVFVILALMPLLFAILGGAILGKNAIMDLKGKTNFFEEKNSYYSSLALVLITSIIIGFMFGADMILTVPEWLPI